MAPSSSSAWISQNTLAMPTATHTQRARAIHAFAERQATGTCSGIETTKYNRPAGATGMPWKLE